MDLAVWSSKMKSSELPWGALDEVMAELDEDLSFRVLRQGVQLASRFLLEHGLPDDLDAEEVDTSVLLEMMEEKEGSIALALSHGLRALCIIEALLTQSPGQSREEVQCRKQTQDLQGLLMRSLSVNHPATFFRALCLSLGVKGKAPKGNASTLLAEQEFVSHLSSRVMSAAAKALKDRRDIRDDDEEAEEGSATSSEATIQHVCKRFLSGEDHAEMATSWELLDEICRFSQQASGSLLTSAVPKAGAFLASLETSPDEAATTAAVKCCQCDGSSEPPNLAVGNSDFSVETMVNTLGHGILPKLKDITQPLLDLAQRVVQSPESNSLELDLDCRLDVFFSPEINEEDTRSQWALPDLICQIKIAVGTAGPQLRAPEPSGRRTSTASPRSQWALPDLNHEPQISASTAGPQPRAPDPSGHCRTSTASPRSQWALPDLNREPQIPVGTAGPQPPDRMPERISVGGVLSPFLGQFLQVVCAPASELAMQLVDGVPHRLLLKEVQKVTVDHFDSEMDLEEAMLRSQRLSTFYLWILMKATPEFVASQDIMPSLLRLFGYSGSAVKAFLTYADAQEIPVRLLKREPMDLITSSNMKEM
eukprot:s49_g29.t1